MPEAEILQSIAELLRSGNAKPLLIPERIAPSTVYDLTYRTAIIAIAFNLYSSPDPSGKQRVRTALIKLLQFVAVRPWLIPMLTEWERSEADPQLSVLTSQKERRGFLSDLMHDHVVEYLVAQEILTRGPSHLGLGAKGSFLTNLSSILQTQGLFENERRALTDMKKIKITNAMLEGS